MQDVAPVVAFVGILVFLAHFFTGVFKRTRIPDVLLLTIIGICVGPVLGLVTPAHFGSVGPIFTTITLVIILFESGLALKLSNLRSALGGALTLAPLSYFLTMFVVAGLALWLTDLEIMPAFIRGAIAGSTSEAIVIPLVRQLKMREENETLLSVESSVNDVLSIVITVALVEAYKLGEFKIAAISSDLVASFLVAIVVGIIGGFIWSLLLSRIHAIKNAAFTTPAFIFVIFGIVEILGFSGAIAALAFGITLGNVQSIRFPPISKKPLSREPVSLTETERIFFSEFAFLLKTFFFVYLGISLELMSGWLFVLGLIMTVLIFAVRIAAVKASASKSIPARDVSLMAIMVPKGLAAVVLASIPLHNEVVGGDLIRNLTYGIVLFSIIGTSILVLLIEKTKVANIYGRIFAGAGRTQSSLAKLEAKTPEIKTTGDKMFG
ncbi:MAG: cation:proton antiporter [Dehalococcoidia bacterium]